MVMTPVPVMEPAVVALLAVFAVVAVDAATLVNNEPSNTGSLPVALVWTNCETPLKVLPAVVMLAVVTPLTAVLLSEPPEIVAVLIVVAPVIAPLSASEVSVPTAVMLL